jgi:hypothetical protein
MKSRETFSRYIYDLHEVINTMLGKKSGLTYYMVRERYEHFRSRCTKSYKEYKLAKRKTIKNKEKRMYGTLVWRKIKMHYQNCPTDEKNTDVSC